jgi:hypothetical protein
LEGVVGAIAATAMAKSRNWGDDRTGKSTRHLCVNGTLYFAFLSTARSPVRRNHHDGQLVSRMLCVMQAEGMNKWMKVIVGVKIVCGRIARACWAREPNDTLQLVASCGVFLGTSRWVWSNRIVVCQLIFDFFHCVFGQEGVIGVSPHLPGQISSINASQNVFLCHHQANTSLSPRASMHKCYQK